MINLDTIDLKYKNMYRHLFICFLFVVSLGFFSNCSDEMAKENLLGLWEPLPAQATDMIWESSAPITISELTVTTPELAEIATQFANILLPEKLQSINFRKDDKLDVTYFNDAGSLVTEMFGTYRTINRSKFSFSPDIDKFLTGAEGISPITVEGIKLLAKVGISVQYYFVGNNTNEIRCNLNTSTLKETKFLLPLLAIAIMGNDADEALIESLLENIPAHLDKTSKIEIGFNFRKSASQ